MGHTLVIWSKITAILVLDNGHFRYHSIKALDVKSNVADELKELTKRLNMATTKMQEQEQLTLDHEDKLEFLQKTIEELVRDHEMQMTTSTVNHDATIKQLQQQSDTLQRRKEGLEQEKSDVKDGFQK